MAFCLRRVTLSCVFACAVSSLAQGPGPSSSSPTKHVDRSTAANGIEDGAVTNGVYRNKSLALSFKIPPAWVLRTEELNAPNEESSAPAKSEERRNAPGSTAESGCPHTCSRVLLAAFARPPEAKGEDVNSSLLIAAESAASYPGLKDAAQYFGPLTEVAKLQGFTMDEEPYEIAVGAKTLVRGDYHKDVGSRVMRQSSLVMLAHGYAVSITVIGGTEDEVEELIDGLTFGATGK